MGGPRKAEYVRSLFVGDSCETDEEYGERLLLASRAFHQEEGHPPSDVPRLDQGVILGEGVVKVAESWIAQVKGEMRQEMREDAEARYATDRERIERRFEMQETAARDKLEATEGTLKRLQGSQDENDRRVIPLWQANVERDRAVLENTHEDEQRELRELDLTRRRSVTSTLLALARVEVED